MEIKIGKASHVCSSCEKSFEHEQRLHSLVRIQDQAFVRVDLCLNCWKPEHAVGAYSTWSLNFYDPRVAEQEPPEAFSPLRQIFYEAVEEDDRLLTAKAYLAAQLLRRQKVFRLIKETDDPEAETSLILFSDRIGNRLIEVRDPSLSQDELEQARVLLLENLTALENPPDVEEENTDDVREALENVASNEEKLAES